MIYYEHIMQPLTTKVHILSFLIQFQRFLPLGQISFWWLFRNYTVLIAIWSIPVLTARRTGDMRKLLPHRICSSMARALVSDGKLSHTKTGHYSRTARFLNVYTRKLGEYNGVNNNRMNWMVSRRFAHCTFHPVSVSPQHWTVRPIVDLLTTSWVWIWDNLPHGRIAVTTLCNDFYSSLFNSAIYFPPPLPLLLSHLLPPNTSIFSFAFTLPLHPPVKRGAWVLSRIFCRPERKFQHLLDFVFDKLWSKLSLAKK